MKWREGKWSEVKWNEVKGREVKWSGMKWSGMKWSYVNGFFIRWQKEEEAEEDFTFSKLKIELEENVKDEAADVKENEKDEVAEVKDENKEQTKEEPFKINYENESSESDKEMDKLKKGMTWK